VADPNLFWGAIVLVATGSIGCHFFQCGEDFEQIVGQGQMILHAPGTPPREEHHVYNGWMWKPLENDRERFPAERARFDRFKRAKEALEDPSGPTTRFGIELGGPFMDAVTGSTTTPGSVRSIRAMPMELSFPLDVGDQIDFRTNVGWSPEGDNAPAIAYAEIEDVSADQLPTKTVFPLVFARGMLTELEPLSIAVEFEAADGRRAAGTITFVHESSAQCD
jgi:hypothetical protein